jgi:arylsulfatase A-like enzyme
LRYNDPLKDTRTPDIVVETNYGVIYTGGTKIAEHGGVSEDDTHVALLVSNPNFKPRQVKSPVTTSQVAPSILRALGLDPAALQAVQKEDTRVLPGLFLELTHWHSPVMPAQ